jgi:hypothetical protein
MNVTRELKWAMDELITYVQTPKAFKANDFEQKIYPRCRKAMDDIETNLQNCKF